MEDFLGILCFAISLIYYFIFWIFLAHHFLMFYSYSLGFPGTFLFLFYIIFWIFMIFAFFIYQLDLRILVIPCFLICNIWCSISHVFFFFILFYGFFFIVIYLFYSRSFLLSVALLITTPFSMNILLLALTLNWSI